MLLVMLVATRKDFAKLTNISYMAKLSAIKMKRGGLKRLCELHPEKSQRTISHYLAGTFDPELWSVNDRNLMMTIRREAQRWAVTK